MTNYHETNTTWPADAPEWATGLERRYYNIRSGQTKTLDYITRPKPVKQKIDWSKRVMMVVERFWNPAVADYFPSPWIAWNCDEHTRGNPLPDGLVVECFGQMTSTHYTASSELVLWNVATRFRIIGIQEGFE